MFSIEGIPATFDGVIASFCMALGQDDVVRIRQNDWVTIRGRRYLVELNCTPGEDPLLGFISSTPTVLADEDAHHCALHLAHLLIDSVGILKMPPIIA